MKAEQATQENKAQSIAVTADLSPYCLCFQAPLSAITISYLKNRLFIKMANEVKLKQWRKKKQHSFIYLHDFHEGVPFYTLVSMPMVFNKETKAVEGAFGYASLKMSKTALPSTF